MVSHHQENQARRSHHPKRTSSKTRRDAGSIRDMTRDRDFVRFVAEQTFVRFDSCGEFLAPGHAPAIALPPDSQLADTRAPAKRPWPADARHRMMAVSRLANKLRDRGYLDLLQPWKDQPAWARVTGAGLRYLGLEWPEIFWPEDPHDIEARLRHDSDPKGYKSHNHLINQVRLLLMRGGAGIPQGSWKGERQIEVELPPREKGTRRPHKADGLWYLSQNGSWTRTSGDGLLSDTIEMQSTQLLAIEVECSQKSDARLAEILPDLLEHHDFVWYFCLTDEVYKAVSKARRDGLDSDEQRRRVRLLKLKDYLPCR